MLWLTPCSFPPGPQGEALRSQLARRLLKEQLEVFGCREGVAKTALGQPYAAGCPELHISVSHCEGLVACAVERQPVGVDAENIRAFHLLTAKRVCTERELFDIRRANDPNRAFFRVWTLKESFGKTMGVGLGYDLRGVEFTLDGGVTCSVQGFDFCLFETIKGYIVALCRQTAARGTENGGKQLEEYCIK